MITSRNFKNMNKNLLMQDIKRNFQGMKPVATSSELVSLKIIAPLYLDLLTDMPHLGRGISNYGHRHHGLLLV